MSEQNSSDMAESESREAETSDPQSASHSESEDDIGDLQRMNPDVIWDSEYNQFTPWLEDNIDIINEQIDDELSVVGREEKVGSFTVDLVANSEDEERIVIENQLTPSDHRHLGQVMTYFTNLDAASAIWIVTDAKPEHINVVSWLNGSSEGSFYLFKIEAAKIDDSNPAPLLTLITGPSEETREYGETKRTLSESEKKRHRMFLKFWGELLEIADEHPQSHPHSAVSASKAHWLGAGAEVTTGVSFKYQLRKDENEVNLYIDTDDGDINQNIFSQLNEHAESIEEDCGLDLDWVDKEGTRYCSICHKDGGGWEDEESWSKIQKDMVERMVRLEAALRPHLDQLEI